MRRKVFRRKGRNGPWRPEITIDQILRWADDFHARTGRWPRQHDGLIRSTLGEKWRNVDNALRYGLRSLQGGSSLAQLLAERRGARNLSALPPYTEEQILSWVDAYHQERGEWPTKDSGLINGVPGETWHAVSAALINGRRGLPGGSSLAQLLASARGVRNRLDLPPFTGEKVLVWVDAYFRRHGKWPTYTSGPIPEAPGETWSAVDSALWQGHRGLSGPSSLAGNPSPIRAHLLVENGPTPGNK